MCFILILVHLQFVAGMSAMLDVFVVRYQCCLNLTWEGFGIMLMTLTGWFDLVLGSDVTMQMGYLFMTSFCNTNIVSSCENYSYILPFLELYVVNVWKLYVH